MERSTRSGRNPQSSGDQERPLALGSNVRKPRRGHQEDLLQVVVDVGGGNPHAAEATRYEVDVACNHAREPPLLVQIERFSPT